MGSNSLLVGLLTVELSRVDRLAAIKHIFIIFSAGKEE